MVEVAVWQLWSAGGVAIAVIAGMLIMMISMGKKKKAKQSKVEKSAEDTLREALRKLESQKETSENDEAVYTNEQRAELDISKQVDAVIKVPPDTKIKEFDYMKTKRSKTDLFWWKDWFLMKFRRHKTVLINMELANEQHRMFLVAENEGGFTYLGKKYIFDDDMKYYILRLNMFCYDYHENIALPIKRKVPVNEIKKNIEQKGISEVEYAINPSTLDRFMRAKIAEGIMRGQQIDEFLKRLNMFMIITMVCCIITLLYILFKTGAFSEVQGFL